MFKQLNDLLIEAQELSPYWWDIYAINEELAEKIIDLVDQAGDEYSTAHKIATDYFIDFNY